MPFISASTYTASTGIGHDFDVSAAQAGDVVLFASTAWEAGGDVTFSAWSWTLIANFQDNATDLRAQYGRLYAAVVPSAASTITASWTELGGNSNSYVLAIYRGFTGWRTWHMGDNTSSRHATAPGIACTDALAGDLVIQVGGIVINSSTASQATISTGWTVDAHVEATAGSQRASVSLASKTGGTDAPTWTPSPAQSVYWNTGSIALIPAAGGQTVAPSSVTASATVGAPTVASQAAQVISPATVTAATTVGQPAVADGMPHVAVYEQYASITAAPAVQVFDQYARVTAQPAVRIYDQAALVGGGSTAAVRVYEQSATTVPFVGEVPGPVWALRGGSWVPWRITLLDSSTGDTTGPGAGGGDQATLLDGNALDLATQSVEQDVSGWTSGQWAGDRAKDGNHSILLVTGQDGIAETTTVAHIPCDSGDAVSASCWAYTQITGVQADVVLTYYNSAGEVVATDSGVHPLSIAPVSLPTAVWTRASLDSTAPSHDAASVTLTASVSGPISTAVHVDRAYLSVTETGGTDPEAVALRSTSTAAVDTGGGNLIMSLPAGTQAGDLLVFFYSSFFPVTSPSLSPVAWTLAGRVQDATGNTYMGIYYRRATGAEPANYTVALGTGEAATGWMGAFTGVIGSDPPVRAFHAGGVTEGSMTAPGPAATDTQAADFALQMAGTGAEGSTDYGIVIPSGWTAAGAPYIAPYSDGLGVAAAYKPAGTSAVTWSTDGASDVDWTTASIALIGQTSTPGGGSPPAAPTGLAHGTATSNSVPLTWNAVTGATGYKVYQGGTAVATATSTTYTATGLSSSTTYSFQVSAVNQYGESPLSSAVSATTTSAGTLPAAPTGLTVGTVTSSSVALSWSAVTGATQYAVYRGTTQVATTTITSYTATGLTASTPYQFQVSAINSVGEGSKSSSVNATTASSGGGTTAAVFFAPRSPINTKIPSNATVASDSASKVSTILRTKLPLIQWGTGATAGGTPIYEATSSTTRYSVIPAYAGAHGSRLPYWPFDPGDTDWGSSPFAGYSIPWDASWAIPGDVASADDDKWVAIRDPQNGLIYELWMTTFNYQGSGGLECWWGSVTDVNTTDGQIRPIAGQATGANISTIAGHILLSELQSGLIPHALTFAGDYSRSTYVYPASNSDGEKGSGTQWVPEGTRIRLDPAYNPEADAALLPYERIIARCLIDYGAYLVDNGAEGTTFYVHKYPASINPATVRATVGMPDAEWIDLTHIPWASRLQVLVPATNPGYY